MTTEKEMLTHASELASLVTEVHLSTVDATIDEKFASERADALEALKYRGIAPPNVDEMLDNIEVKTRAEFDALIRTAAARAIEMQQELEAS